MLTEEKAAKIAALQKKEKCEQKEKRSAKKK